MDYRLGARRDNRIGASGDRLELRAVAESDERLDVEAALERLNEALERQQRSVLQYTVASASLFGVEAQALGERLWTCARDELDDLRWLVEKIAALGGKPTTRVAPMDWTGDAAEATDRLIATETEAIDLLKEAIGPTGREGRSEALEHRLEHMIMRKQSQVDFLLLTQRRA